MLLIWGCLVVQDFSNTFCLNVMSAVSASASGPASGSTSTGARTADPASPLSSATLGANSHDTALASPTPSSENSDKVPAFEPVLIAMFVISCLVAFR